MEKSFSFVRKFATNTSSRNLHRWGNHINTECKERITQCMSMNWSDYSVDTLHESKRINITKTNDERYMQVLRKKNIVHVTSEKIPEKVNNYDDFANYFNLEMRASMMM